MTKIICFTPHYNEKHTKVLRAFAEGCGAEVRDVRDYVDCDIAVIFGTYKRAVAKTYSKLNIIKRHMGTRLIIIDSAPVRRGDYWAAGFGGLGGYADFRLEAFEPSLSRWNTFGVPLLPWKNNPEGPAVVIGQLHHDAAVQDTDHLTWAKSIFYLLISHGVKTSFRPHPLAKRPRVYGIPEKYWDVRPLPNVLEEARCVVTWNSTVGVDAAIFGTPVFAFDRGSFAYPVAEHIMPIAVIGDTSIFGNDGLIKMPDRGPWAAKLAYCQWNLKEMRDGTAWAHLNRP